MFNDPLMNIEWREASSLSANDYNPNVVYTTELKQIAKNILEFGWIQPILISKGGVIIDGFHRWRISQDNEKIKAKYDGKVPCAVLDVNDAQARILTVRMNRAKGVHIAVRMAGVVQDLIDDGGMTMKELAKEIGSTTEEVRILYENSIFKSRNLAEAPYSKAWIPRESRITPKPE